MFVEMVGGDEMSFEDNKSSKRTRANAPRANAAKRR